MKNITTLSNKTYGSKTWNWLNHKDTFCEKKSGGLWIAQHPVSSIGLMVRLTETLQVDKVLRWYADLGVFYSSELPDKLSVSF